MNGDEAKNVLLTLIRMCQSNTLTLIWATTKANTEFTNRKIPFTIFFRQRHPTDRPTLNTGHAITESQHWGWRKEGRNTHEVFSRFLLSFLAVYFVRWWWQKRPLERKQKVRSSYKHDPHIFFFLPPFLSQSRVSFYFSTGCFNILTQYWILTMYIRKSKCNMNDLI